MPDYKYTAMDLTEGKKVTGTLSARNEKDLKKKLKKAGKVFLSLEGKKKGSGGAKKAGKSESKKEKKVGMFSKVTLKEITVFSRQLATMISSGVTLLKSIQVMAAQNENPLMKQVLGRIENDISSGLSFSEALSKHPNQFNHLYVNMVKAGEESGSLEVVLNRLAVRLEKNQELRGKVKAAMMYPIIVLSVALIIVFGLLTFVVPRFTSMFQDAGMELPGLTQGIVDVSNFLKVYWWVIILTITIIVFGVKKYISTDKGKLKWDRMMLKLPIMGDFKRKVAVGRFTRTMATLLNTGVPILKAFDIVTEVIDNRVISDSLKTAKTSIKEGNTIAQPLKESGEFPGMVTQMLEIGEESGAITQMLEKVADFNEQEIEEATNALVAALEPLAIILMAVLVGTIVIGMFLPMFKLSDVAG